MSQESDLPPALPPWGTPEPVAQAEASGYRQPTSAPISYGTPETPCYLLLEQTCRSGDAMHWNVDPLPTRLFPDRATARAAARQLCGSFHPQHPFSEQSRTVYQISPDQYLVTVQGMTRSFHFRISVAERMT